MGYRSEVIAVIYTDIDKPEECATLDLFMRENFPELMLNSFEQTQAHNEKGKEGLARLETNRYLVYQFFALNIKWYPSYDSVRATEDFFRKVQSMCNDEGNPWSYEFIRLGEESDDVETHCSDDMDWLLQVSRSVEVNY